eukprot:TRINITY_DN5096_c0_g1_i1.p1 TRINITY_DN5096_c0_g1~~TRINITY_DN5096_c0_g1_i1.p1  ORF type:complete len:778 (-),score=246.58 TRINITY_DN5096_c0_g1_i1:24-2357(-)
MRVLVRGGVWKNTEDEILKAAVMKYGKNQWARIASLLARKSAKQCKARWNEWLDPSIKKTEWSREEEEKLLHLAKIMPCQWRTIAPRVGRTAAQCLEHYEKLLDAATEGGYDAADDPRRLRPGEIDPNPESKPALPDRVDMEEEEKEMLQEARARLANTQGKKAKRKAREKQLEEARRLAALQKTRELKAAGINVPRKVKVKKGFADLNKEIPFLHKPPPGFFPTASERDRERKEREDPNFNPVLIQQIEGKRRDDIAEENRKRDKEKMKRRMEKNLPEVIKQMNSQTNIPGRTGRSRINLPGPQMQEEEIGSLSKMGYNPEEDYGDTAADVLLRDYLPTPAIHSKETQYRTPQRQDTVMMEAQNLRTLTESSTPLIPSENEFLHPSDFSGATPKKAAVATPNPLKQAATPVKGTPMATPTGTPYRDQLNINNDDSFMDIETKQEHRLLQTRLKSDLSQGLANLPSPQNKYNIALPELPEGYLDENLDTIERGTSGFIEDATSARNRKLALQKERRDTILRNRSTVLKRDLPRPYSVNTSFSKSHEEVEELIDSEDYITELIKREMVDLMIYDALTTPTKEARPPKGISKKNFTLKEIEENYVRKAKKYLEREMDMLTEDYGQVSLEEYNNTWERCHEDLVYIPRKKKYNLNSMALSVDDQLGALEFKFNNIVSDLNRQERKANKLKKKLEIYNGGYEKRIPQLTREMRELYHNIDKVSMELDCFTTMYEQESKAIPYRINSIQIQVDGIRKAENEHQNLYRALLLEKEVLDTIISK